MRWAKGCELGAIEPSEPLLDAGLDSLGFARLRHSLSRQLGVTIPGRELSEGISTQRLAQLLAQQLSFGPAVLARPALPPPETVKETESAKGAEGEYVQTSPKP